MPFTGSHPALVIPILKSRYFSASGLIMGSMIPDFEFILLMKTNVVYGHSLSPMFWLNLPLSLILLFVYHNLVRKSMIQNLPDYFEKRLRPFLYFDWNRFFKDNFLKVIISILLGNLGHLFWDAFTHSHGVFVEWMSFLKSPVNGVPLYHILQYGFSLLGAVALLLFFHRQPYKSLSFYNKKKLKYWIVVSVVMAIVLLLRLGNVVKFYFEEWIICILCAFMIGLVVASIFDGMNYTNKKRSDQVSTLKVETD
ncbi:uncharacterized protein DUF4184 [Flavobacteriaceae bacterium MAR_2009_75]|nr:uncharacterized protein DUF4184 [Flavobacteriaceae bacterium MAR_2009_75]